MEIQDKLSEGEYIDGQFIDKDYIDRKMKDYNKNRRYKLYDEWSYNFGIIVADIFPYTAPEFLYNLCC